ncbi:TPA: hypothetical protein ACGO35_000190 [Streptococcus suis]
MQHYSLDESGSITTNNAHNNRNKLTYNIANTSLLGNVNVLTFFSDKL